jgi:hypothetical protein
VGSDTTAFDGTVNGASFVQNGGVTDVVSGQNPSGAYDFDGVDDEIVKNIPISAPCTYSFFVNLDTNNGTHIFNMGKADTADRKIGQMLVRNNLEIFFVDVAGGQAVEEIVNVPSQQLGSFFHVAVVINSKNSATAFIDGAAVSSTLSSNQALGGVSNNRFLMGNSGFGDNFSDSQMDDLRTYNRALSASEINQIYENTDPDQ